MPLSHSVKNVTCVCLGGGLTENILFVTSASLGLSKDELARQKYAGGLFAVKVRHVCLH
jgi:sugar lactone lactonase YvrE